MFSSRLPGLRERNELTRLLESRQADASFIDLTESNPTRVGLAYPEARIREALSGAESLLYDPHPRGLLLAREAVAGYYAATGLEVSADRVVLTASTSEAYAFLFKLLADPQDEILVPRPSYPLFEHLTTLECLRPATYRVRHRPDHGWRLDRDTLESGFTPRTRAVVVVHPNNPTGSYLDSEEIDFVTSFCAERGVALIADEVFFDYPNPNLDPARVRVGSRGSALTFALSGLSKVAGLPQVKLGWIVVGGPPRQAEEALERLDFVADAYLSASMPAQHAAPGLLAFSSQIGARIRARVAENESMLATIARDSGALRVRERQGGWSAVLELPSGLREEEFAMSLLEQDSVLVHPGFFYDVEEENLVVVGLLAPPPAFRAGLERMARRAAAR